MKNQKGGKRGKEIKRSRDPQLKLLTTLLAVVVTSSGETLNGWFSS